MVHMKNVWIWAVFCILFFHIVQTEQVYADDYIVAEWIFEPDVDGSIYVKVKITIEKPRSTFSLRFEKDRLVKNVEAREVKTGKTIKITKIEEEERIRYKCEFDSRKEEGFQFIFECDIMEEVIEKGDEIFYFEWEWSGPHKSQATVILPKDYQLLYTEKLSPEEVSFRSGCTSVTFERPQPESETFYFGVFFSKKGAELIEEGDSKFNLGCYDEAKLTYQEAITFYQSEEFSGEDVDKSLEYLQNRVTEINDILQKKKTDNDGDGCSQFEDCNDNDPDIYLGAKEICDRKDNNCDGQTDEGFDKDGDGYTVCEDDCDDNDPKIHPGAQEPCGKDYNCDGQMEACKVNLEVVSILFLLIFGMILTLFMLRLRSKSKKECPLCKREIRDDWTFCPYCGAEIKEDTQIYY